MVSHPVFTQSAKPVAPSFTSNPMAAADTQEGAEHVTDFLKRIKELGEQRDQEDTERTRQLEEQLQEARRQREERRRGPSMRPIYHSHSTLADFPARPRSISLTREADTYSIALPPITPSEPCAHSAQATAIFTPTES